VHALQDGLGAALYVLLPLLAQSFGLSYAQVGIVRAAQSTPMALLELPSGILAERFGESRLLIFGLTCAGIGYLTLTLASGLWTLMACLFVAGSGAAFQHSLASSLVSKGTGDAARRAALGAYNASGDAGKLAFTGILTLGIGMGLAWQDVVSGLGVVSLLGVVALWMLLRGLVVAGRVAAPRSARVANTPSRWGVRNRNGFAILISIVFFDTALGTGFLTFVAFLMIDKQLPAGLAVFATTLTLAGGVFGKFGCGYLAQRIGVVHALITMKLLSALGIVAVLLAPTLLAYCLLPFLGLALQGSSSITYATVSDLIHEERQSRGFAVIYTVANVAGVLGPVLFGLVGDRFGITVSMLAMTLVAVFLIPMSLLLRPALARAMAT
jgi:FSR family fosmidomycin resistance protein-like MFS transporter